MVKLRKIKSSRVLRFPENHERAQHQMKRRYIQTVKRNRVRATRSLLVRYGNFPVKENDTNKSSNNRPENYAEGRLVSGTQRGATHMIAGVKRAANRHYQNDRKSIAVSITTLISRAIKATVEHLRSTTATASIAGIGSVITLTVVAVVFVLAMTISSSFGEYDLELSDNDLVNVALTQVGNDSGEAYCRWYGFNEEVGWCAIFVSWCGTEAGLVKKGLMPKFAWVPTGVYWFQSREQWYPSDYTPKPGDIIFFDWYDFNLDEDGEEIGQDGQADHVGIVEKVKNGLIYTVEGNTTELGICAVKRYPIRYFEILGYGEILYP